MLIPKIGGKYLHNTKMLGLEILDSESYRVSGPDDKTTLNWYLGTYTISTPSWQHTSNSISIVPISMLNLSDFTEVAQFPWEKPAPAKQCTCSGYDLLTTGHKCGYKEK